MAFTAPDGALTLATLLSGSWNSSNTAGRTPSIDEKEKNRRITPGDGDVILVYVTTEKREPIGLSHSHYNVHDVVSLDMSTDLSRAQMYLIETEVLRILADNKTDPATYPSGAQYGLIEPGGVRWLQDYTNFWRKVMEVNLKAFWSGR